MDIANSPANAGPLKLLVDENLTGLVRWYRFAGADVKAAAGESDRDLAAQAVAEGRVLLTRDAALASAMPVGLVILLNQDGRYAQWKAAVKATGLPARDSWFTRCAICNFDLEALSEEAAGAEAAVPLRLREKKLTIRKCQECQRAYWEGSHHDRVRSFLEASLA